MPIFDKADSKRLLTLHPMLQTLLLEAIKDFPFTIRDTNRNRADQTKALKGGFSKVPFGESAHNWTPSIAVDIYALPVNLKDEVEYPKLMIKMQMEVIKPTAARLKIPIRQGCDWNRNGIVTDEKFKDLPHVELFPWREWAKEAKLFE